MISIILPSIHESLLARALQSIYAASEGICYEIVVVSPFYVEGPRIRWVEERISRGSTCAVAAGYKAATGDLIALTADDLVPGRGWLKQLWDYYWARAADTFPLSVGLRRGGFGTVYGKYYPFFPCMSRGSIEASGGWYSEEYISSWGDPDLGLRVWQAGGLCEVCPIKECTLDDEPDRLGYTNPRETPAISSVQLRDQAVFIKKWHPIYGAKWGRKLRDFNLDMDHKHLVNNSFNVDDPAYCRSIALSRGDSDELSLPSSDNGVLLLGRKPKNS